MKDHYYKKLALEVDINELAEYFSIVETKYSHLKWTYEKCKDNVSDKWHDIFKAGLGNHLYSGWSIVSNLPEGEICPPLNESITKTRLDSFRNTELSFGIVKRLQEKIPFAYKWAIMVQPPGGKVFKHDDRGEYITHVMIESNPNATYTFYKSPEESHTFSLTVDGSMNTLNVGLKHETQNVGNQDRISLIFVIKQEDWPKLEELNGKV